ncbi:MAG: SH3 domain-containing protein [Nitrospinae bacterium]|nr:SH3 domain-containing protein [Nitrospinota bacterium]
MKTARLLTAFLVLMLVAASVRADEVMVNNKEAKIRNGPGTNYTVLWKPRLYTPLEVLAKHADWYAVRDVEGDVGWLHESVGAKDPAAIVTANMADVHASPDADSPVKYQAPKNYTFKVVETKGSWLKVVDPEGDEGWVAQKAVWIGGGAAQPKAKEEKKEPKKESKKEAKKSKKK